MLPYKTKSEFCNIKWIVQCTHCYALIAAHYVTDIFRQDISHVDSLTVRCILIRELKNCSKFACTQLYMVANKK